MSEKDSLISRLEDLDKLRSAPRLNTHQSEPETNSLLALDQF